MTQRKPQSQISLSSPVLSVIGLALHLQLTKSSVLVPSCLSTRTKVSERQPLNYWVTRALTTDNKDLVCTAAVAHQLGKSYLFGFRVYPVSSHDHRHWHRRRGVWKAERREGLRIAQDNPVPGEKSMFSDSDTSLCSLTTQHVAVTEFFCIIRGSFWGI